MAEYIEREKLNYKCRRKTVIKSNYCPNCGAKMDGGGGNAAD